MDPISTAAPTLAGRVVLSQRWSDLLFIHWRADPAEIAPLLPAGIVPDEFDGSTWVGLIPFRMSQTRVLGAVPVPHFGTFTEVNVRLYGVDPAGRRGVVFLSLEASRLAAVVTARAMFSLPYFWASATASRDGRSFRYESRRIGGGAPTSRIVGTAGSEAVTDSALAEFLTARWLLFETRGRRTVAMPNEHEPWPLFTAELTELDDRLIAASGITSIGTRAPDSVLYSPGVTTRFGVPTRVMVGDTGLEPMTSSV